MSLNEMSDWLQKTQFRMGGIYYTRHAIDLTRLGCNRISLIFHTWNFRKGERLKWLSTSNGNKFCS